MSQLTSLIQAVKNLTDRFNQFLQNAKKVNELPPQTILNVDSLIHVMIDGVSQYITVQQILDGVIVTPALGFTYKAKYLYTDSNIFTVPDNVKILDVRPNGTSSFVDWFQEENQITVGGTPALAEGDFLIVIGQYSGLELGAVPTLQMVGTSGSSFTGNLQTPYAVNPEDLTPLAQVVELAGGTVLPTANKTVKRDEDANVFFNNYFANLESTVSASGTTVLTIASGRTQRLTGALPQTYILPDATTLPLGSIFDFDNNSSASLTIANTSGTSQYVVPAGGSVHVILTSNSVANGTWNFHALTPGSVTWGSGITGLIMNSVLSTSPSIASGASSATIPAFIPQRGASTTGYGGDGTRLQAIIAGVARLIIEATGTTAPKFTATTDNAYDDTTWDGSLRLATENSVRDKIVSLSSTVIRQQVTSGYEYFNDFEGPVVNAVNDSHVLFNTGGGGAFNPDSSINTGLFFTTGLSNPTGSARIYSAQNNTVNSNFEIISLFKVIQLATISEQFYVVIGRSSQFNSFGLGMYFSYDRYDALGNGFTNNNWICVVRNVASITAVDSGIAVSTASYQKLTVELNNLAQVVFRINNVIVATITTNIVTTPLLSVMGIYKTVGTSQMFLSADYVYIASHLITPRI